MLSSDPTNCPSKKVDHPMSSTMDHHSQLYAPIREGILKSLGTSSLRSHSSVHYQGTMKEDAVTNPSRTQSLVLPMSVVTL